MKISFDKLDKAFENRVRLQIMSVLVANDRYDFNSLKDLLNITDGSLAAHFEHTVAITAAGPRILTTV